jgi:hypothetical protein
MSVSVFFPGDQVCATVDGQVLAGVIEDFNYMVPDYPGGPWVDSANVRVPQGDLIPVPMTALRAVT